MFQNSYMSDRLLRLGWSVVGSANLKKNTIAGDKMVYTFCLKCLPAQEETN